MLWLLLKAYQFWDCVEGEDISVATYAPIQKNLHVVENPMVSSNMSIEDEDNVMLTNYGKNIGHAMKGIRVSIFFKMALQK